MRFFYLSNLKDDIFRTLEHIREHREKLTVTSLLFIILNNCRVQIDPKKKWKPLFELYFSGLKEYVE